MATTEIWVLYSAFLSCILSDIGKVILSCNYRFTIAQKSVSVCVCVCVHVRVCGVCACACVCLFPHRKLVFPSPPTYLLSLQASLSPESAFENHSRETGQLFKTDSCSREEN